jgi:hypothetical protein
VADVHAWGPNISRFGPLRREMRAPWPVIGAGTCLGGVARAVCGAGTVR